MPVELGQDYPVQDVNCAQDKHDQGDDEDDVVSGDEVSEDASGLRTVHVRGLEHVRGQGDEQGEDPGRGQTQIDPGKYVKRKKRLDNFELRQSPF